MKTDGKSQIRLCCRTFTIAANRGTIGFPPLDSLTLRQKCDQIVADFDSGFGSTGMRCSLIGFLIATASVGLADPAHALTVDGTTVAFINDGASIDATVSDGQSSFSNEIGTSSDTTTFMSMTYSFGTIAFSEIPVNGNNFTFIFDSQETGGGRPISIDDIVLAVGSDVYFDYDEAVFGSLELNYAAPFTDSPLGNGSDMALNVPVSLFVNQGLTGSDVLTLYWKQSDDHNGADEWVTVGGGFFDPGGPIYGIPLPAGLPLLVGGFAALALFRRRTA